MPILVTGAAGFIGFHVAKRFLDYGAEVIGIDNFSDYYDVRLKEARVRELQPHKGFRFLKLDLADRAEVKRLFAESRPSRVIHLAAQAGVRYSVSNPHAYVDSNLTGFVNVLEGCRHTKVEHLVFASSSSVYGTNTRMPFSVHDNVDHPISLYAATKKANELMAHAYSHLYGLPTTGLRFFTVYGPWSRPDMAVFLFTKAVLEGRPIDLFNEGRMKRDFTYVGDVVEGVLRVANRIPAGSSSFDPGNPDPATSRAPYRIYNIGNNNPVEITELIDELERLLQRKATKRFLPMQAGDVAATYADVTDLARDVEFHPSTPLADGLGHFVSWYRDYYGA